MNSSLIGKIEKAKRYVKEPDRITLNSFEAGFQGDHDEYKISLKENHWNCSCHFFAMHGLCSHTLAAQKILQELLPDEAASPAALAGSSLAAIA